MPQKSTFRSGATTSRSVFARAACNASGVGLDRADDVAAGLLVRVEADEVFLFGILEQVGEGAEAVVRLVEARIAALERLLDHRAPDALVLAALGDERLQRLDQEVERLLLLVLARRRRLAALLRRAALLLVLAHEVVVVDELVAVRDEQIRARVLHADADHRLRVL